jgi:DNA-binding transcriptional regulator YiaG
MTPAELRDIRKRLGLTQIQFAPLVGAGGARTIQMWESGDRKIPRSVAMLAQICLARHTGNHPRHIQG